MSLVNDMLRDLEARRAPQDAGQPFAGLNAVDEQAGARRARRGRAGRALAIVAAAVAIGAPLGWWMQPAAPVVPEASSSETTPVPAEPMAAPAPEPVIEPAASLLAVLPQNDGRRFALQLLLDRPVSYQRSDEGTRVTLWLADVRLSGAAQHGEVLRDGLGLSWRVAGEDGRVCVELGGDGLQVQDRLEPAGDGWQLWVETSLVAEAGAPEVNLAELPAAEPAAADEDAGFPDWAMQTVPVEPAEAKAAPAPRVAAEPAPVRAPRAELHIAAHHPDTLTEARQALVAGDHARAVEALVALHRQQPDNPEAARWLARAYLASGRLPELLAWLPAALAARPFDSELRALLARGQLQAGDGAGAIATLREQAPALDRDPSYFALQAAIHQQLGDWADSAALYQRLLQLSPDQAVWRLGLAIALEQLSRPRDAAAHYRLALRGQGLDDDTRRYAEARAAALAAVSGDTP
ncbi:tetratricopeptide repeat protein [Stutzerimonas azotifigens]|uniref:tetratricopeptide repeat protein n=1 Tax=Stutzerimonas azotifigens TaxID=291995 RepID=UPI0003FE1CBF|nr:tetratricopeptide repeat protein [Stutzerimonas azotifigens]